MSALNQIARESVLQKKKKKKMAATTALLKRSTRNSQSLH